MAALRQEPVVPAEFRFHINGNLIRTIHRKDSGAGIYCNLQKGDVIYVEMNLRNRFGAIVESVKGEKIYESGDHFPLTDSSWVFDGKNR
jgi:hypothetical protein